jgi:hypothetical protein
MILDNKTLEFKQANHYADEKVAFILVFRVFCDHRFHAKAKSENKWKNKCLKMH